MSLIAVDTSALVALLLGEPDAEMFEETLFRAQGTIVLSSANYLEALIVAEARAPHEGARDLRALVDVLAISVEQVTQAHGEVAFRAFTRFGKGRHPAGLNYGDCFAYALAKCSGAPLLFKGDDFAQTDITSALDEPGNATAR